MKTNIIKALSFIMLIACFGKMNAQNDLFSVNATSAPTSVSDLYKSKEKIVISDFKRSAENEVNMPVVTVKSENSVTLQVRIFNLSGNLAKEEVYDLNNGLNDLKIDMSNLNQGVYMVQFYTKEGSAVRRWVKSN